MKSNTLYKLIAAFAFACIISACQISSYHADKYHLNGLYWGLSVVTGLTAILLLVKLIKSQR